MNQHLRPLTAVVAALFVASCHTPTPTENLAAPTPVATTTVADSQGVIPRFTHDIWPAIDAYNSDISQGSPGYQQLIKIMAGAVVADGVRAAAKKLGTVQEGNQSQPHIVRDGSGLRLADTSLTALDPSKATLQVCYTYSADTRRTINDPPAQKPFASEAIVELRKTGEFSDNWYLYAITNDHVVQGCPESSRA